MSLSDGKENGFQPIDLKSLDRFDSEIISRKGDPDFDRFKLLFDPAEFVGDEPISFQALFTVEKKNREEPFEPLIKIKKPRKNLPGERSVLPEPPDGEGSLGQGAASFEEKSPEELAVEQGYEDGYQQGFARGEEQGFAKGEAEGFAKGEKQGFAKGESEGFARGEKKGFEHGEQQGIEQGEEKTREEAKKILETLNQALTSVDSLLDNLVEKHEEQLLALVFKIAQKVVMATVDSRDEVVKHTILDALKSLARPEKIVLSISPEDYEYIEMIKDSFFQEVESLSQISVQSDPLVRRGGCRIETATGSVATDPETKLQAVYNALIQTGK